MDKKTDRPDQDDLTADGNAKIEEACKFLGVGRSTIYVLTESGQLPFIKIGKCRRIPWRALRQFNASCLTGGVKVA